MGGWSLVSFLSKPLGGLATPVPFEGKRHSIERVAPDGTRYTVDSRDAIYRLTTSAEDEHSQHIFTNYASALRYAREHHLPSIPSVSLVQTTCRAADEQFQIALERALFDDPQTGRRVLLARWLDDLVARRQLAPPANRPAYDRACRYVAQAITLGGGSPAFPTDLRSDPAFNQAAADSPLGPWGMDDRLVAIWKCDRFLASGLVVTDDSSAAAAAVLARSLAADPVLSAGWERQARIAKVLVGLPSGTTLESLAEVL